VNAIEQIKKPRKRNSLLKKQFQCQTKKPRLLVLLVFVICIDFSPIGDSAFVQAEEIN